MQHLDEVTSLNQRHMVQFNRCSIARARLLGRSSVHKGMALRVEVIRNLHHLDGRLPRN